MNPWTIVAIVVGFVVIAAIAVYGIWCWWRIPGEMVKTSKAMVDFYESLGKLYETLAGRQK